MMFGSEKLEVWRKAIDFAGIVYSLNPGLPGDPPSGRAARMRRAAVAIAANIAEGSARSSRKDFIRRVGIACGSLDDVVSMARAARGEGLLDHAGSRILHAAAREQRAILGGLRRSLIAGD